jgi:radical SAM protein with 4Fe4S-binding SPASM domain
MEKDAGVLEGFIILQHKYHKETSYGMILNNRAGSFKNATDNLMALKEPLNEPCYMPFYKILVDWNLNVYFCDYDWAKRVLLGNLEATEMAELWMSPTMRTIRESLFQGNRNFTPCKFCNAKGSLYGKKQADVIMQYYKE